MKNIFSPNYSSEEKKQNETSTELPPIMEMKDIYQSYDSTGEIVFEGLGVRIPDIPDYGQFLTLVGPSGSGKSTLLRYISHLQKPTSGSILIRGQKPDPRKSVPMVFQAYTNLEWKTVIENVMLPLELQMSFWESFKYKIGLNSKKKKEFQEKAMEILKIVGLEEHAQQYAKAPLLSGGQLQRVAIARSIITNPDILLMDEPFGALDVKTRQEMQIFLRKIFESKKDMTVILVTHDISEAVFLSDLIYVLDKKPVKKCKKIEIPFGPHRDESIIGTIEFKNCEAKVREALGL